MKGTLTDHEVEALIAGQVPAGREELAELSELLAGLRRPPTVPAPSSELALWMQAQRPTRTPSPMHLPPHALPLGRRFAAWIAGLGIGVQSALGITAAAAALTSAGIAGILPDAMQRPFDDVRDRLGLIERTNPPALPPDPAPGPGPSGDPLPTQDSTVVETETETEEQVRPAPASTSRPDPGPGQGRDHDPAGEPAPDQSDTEPGSPTPAAPEKDEEPDVSDEPAETDREQEPEPDAPDDAEHTPDDAERDPSSPDGGEPDEGPEGGTRDSPPDSGEPDEGPEGGTRDGVVDDAAR